MHPQPSSPTYIATGNVVRSRACGIIARRTQRVRIQFALAEVEWQPKTPNVITGTTPHRSVLLRVQLKRSNHVGHQRTTLNHGDENTASQNEEEQLPDP